MSWSRTEHAWVVFNIPIRSLQCLSSTQICGYMFTIIVIVLLLCWLYRRTTTGHQNVSSRMSPSVSSSVHPVRGCVLHASVSPLTQSFGGPRNVPKDRCVSRHALRVSKFAHPVNACLSTHPNGGLPNVRPDPFVSSAALRVRRFALHAIVGLSTHFLQPLVLSNWGAQQIFTYCVSNQRD